MQVNINQDILEQFTKRFGDSQSGDIVLRPQDGTGKIMSTCFPADLSLLHFSFQLKQAFSISSYNPLDSEWFLLNVNLSDSKVEKQVNGQALELQKYLPSGMLLYAPGIQVSSRTPAKVNFEIVLIRFSKNFLSTYFGEGSEALLQLNETALYEDIDAVSESLLKSALSTSTTLLRQHAILLEFLSRFFNKVDQRAQYKNHKAIHEKDLKGLFLAAARLRNPLVSPVPTINELAVIAGMSETKFKVSFRQVFGAAPLRYFRNIRMEYAQKELRKQTQTASELSYRFGYSHPSKFTAAFKKHFGVLPSEI